jgi:hypothetical protein
VDGCSNWQTIWHVILPLLSPVTVVVVVISIIDSLRAFDLVSVMTRGGPYYSSSVLANFMYIEAFNNYKMGYGAAISVILFILSAVFIFLYLWRGHADGNGVLAMSARQFFRSPWRTAGVHPAGHRHPALAGALRAGSPDLVPVVRRHHDSRLLFAAQNALPEQLSGGLGTGWDALLFAQQFHHHHSFPDSDALFLLPFRLRAGPLPVPR